MESKEKNTKEKILEEALKLFAQSGYMGTSMNDIASKLGVTKAALYKHYKSKQEILDSIIEKMKELDIERAKQYEMPEGDLEKVTAEYKEMAFDKIKQFTKVQFLHWTEEEFSSCFRKMLTLEQYREPQMAQLYQNYLASGPLTLHQNRFLKYRPLLYTWPAYFLLSIPRTPDHLPFAPALQEISFYTPPSFNCFQASSQPIDTY